MSRNEASSQWRSPAVIMVSLQQLSSPVSIVDSRANLYANVGERMLLALSAVTKTYQAREESVTVLDGVNLHLKGGESLALTGESGSGKSTLMHLVAGLDTADAGAVVVDGQDIARAPDAVRAALRRGTVGLIFQQFNLIPSLDVAANLAFQARLAGRHDPIWVAELAQALGLDRLLARYPEQLSGGQQQRVAVGRALAVRPQLVLADEPTGNLDEATGDAVMDLMLQLVAQTGAGLLMVTHSQRLAARLDRTLRLSAGRVA
jgi:putative ABC transport system ATP-binding protein